MLSQQQHQKLLPADTSYKLVDFDHAWSIRLEADCLDPHSAASTALNLAAVKAVVVFCLAASATS